MDHDDRSCFVNRFDIAGRDRNSAVVVNVDLNAGFVDDFIDNLAALADNVADLFGIDHKRSDLGSPLGKFGTGCSESLEHLVQNKQSAFSCLSQRGAENFTVDTLDFDIHLNCGDTLGSTLQP